MRVETDSKDYRKIFIHFDVKDHHIRFDSHLAALEASNVIVGEINKRLFGGKIDYELLVLPSEQGTFKIVIGFLSIAWLSIQIGETKSFEGFVKGLTGYDWKSYEIAKDIGSFLRDSTKGFFMTEKDELEKIIPQEINLDKAIKFKSEFYKKCIANDEIKGLGFEDDDQFPVKRTNFLKHVSLEDKIRDVPSEFFIFDATIIASVNVDKNYKWRIKNNASGELISTYMNDDDFKARLLDGKNPLKRSSKDDIIKVLVEYKRHEKNGEIEIKEKSINTIYNFNDEQIKSVPEGLLEKITTKSEEKLPMEELWRSKND